jgi:hypothetical protein
VLVPAINRSALDPKTARRLTTMAQAAMRAADDVARMRMRAVSGGVAMTDRLAGRHELDDERQ